MKYLKFLPVLLFLIQSCSKDKKDINSKPVADFTVTDEIDQFILRDKSKDIDGDALTYKWVSMCDTIGLTNTYSSSAYLDLPELNESKQINIKHVVSDGILSDSIVKEITLPKTTLQRKYGLGIDLENEHSNDVGYCWYYDQMNSGTWASVNCGPTSVTMAIKWANKDFNKTPEDARNTYRSGGGWWYTDDIINYLNKYSINNYAINIAHINSLLSEISIGNIAILCLDIYYIRDQEKDKWHIDKFYRSDKKGAGHFIVIKGFKKVDDELFYEAYDPASFGEKYSDGSIKGKDRYYRGEDLDSAVINWWRYAIIVSKNNLKGSNSEVDIDEIEHKSGF